MRWQRGSSIALCCICLGMPISGLPILGSERVVAQESLPESQEKKNTADQLFNQGNQLFNRSQFREALISWEQALLLYREIGDRQGEGDALGNIGLAYRNLGQYKKAITYHEQSLSIAKEISDRHTEGNALNNIGLAYRNLGQYKKAITYHEQSLMIAKEIGYRQGEGNALGNIGIAYDSLGQYKKAITSHEQSLMIFKEIGDRRGEGIVLNNIGNAYYSLGQYKKAITYHEQSLTIAKKIGDRQGEGQSLGNIGNAYYSLGQYEKAITYHEQYLSISKEIGYRWGVANSLNSHGIAYENLIRYPQAEEYLYQSIQNWEILRNNLKDSHQISIFDTHNFAYRNLQRVLLAQSKNNAALVVSERGRSRALIQLLASSLKLDSELPNIALIKSVAQQQKATIVEYSLLANQALVVWVVTPSGEIHMEKVLLNNLNDSIESLARKNRLWLQQARGSEDKDTEINKILRGNPTIAYNSNTNNPTQTSKDSLRKLHQYLIKPISRYLPEDESESVIFIPHRSLFQVPFAALIDEEGNYLIHSHTIRTAPSIQALVYTRQHQQRVHNQSQEALIVGDPTIPLAANSSDATEPLKQLKGTRKEARSIASRIKGASPLIGNQATETEVKQRLHQSRLIHLATHGIFSDKNGDPIQGYVVLAESKEDDGLLTVGEIIELTQGNLLNAEMIVLSACETGVGDIRGEGVVGLSRALIAAGVPSVVVSLWNVEDESTSLLMQYFYQNLLEKKMDKATALRQAMLDVSEEYPDPKHWAAFTLIGES